VSSPALLAIDAGTLFTPLEKFSPGRLLVEGTSIAAAGMPESVHIPPGTTRVDASQWLVMPGFIDPHVHGCGGVDVMDGTYESLNAVSRLLVRHGTTSFLPTTVSSPAERLTNTVGQLGSALSKSFDGAQPMGIHLEGPFISAARRGTHQASNVLAPNADLFARWVERSGRVIRLLTIAPELDGIDRLLMLAQHFGITVAMGHSDATFDEAKVAAGRGVCYAVHTFNAMRPFSHRDPGIVGEVLSDDRIFAEIIADGIHVDEAVVRIFAVAKGKSRVLLVTDAISATDMPDGNYRLGESMVEVTNGICRDAEGRLAGSTLTQEIALRNFSKWTRWPFEHALLGLTANPAKALSLDKKGSFDFGADADIVALDNNFRVMKTWVTGRLVFDRSSTYG
jgi:N-acetylglucosamine-6-phosphate deacetylase